MMPYKLEVLVTYKGRLGSESMLPSSGNALGGMWVVVITPGCGLPLPAQLKRIGSIREVLVESIIFWQGALGSPMLSGGALRIASSAAKGRMRDANFACTWNLFDASVFRTGHSSLLRANRLSFSRAKNSSTRSRLPSPAR